MSRPGSAGSVNSTTFPGCSVAGSTGEDTSTLPVAIVGLMLPELITLACQPSSNGSAAHSANPASSPR